MGRSPGWNPGGELLAIGAILIAYLGANVAVIRSRPAMMDRAVATVDSLLHRDQRIADRELLRWRDGLLDDGRWTASLASLVLDAGASHAAGTFAASDVARLRALATAQLPTARIWVIDQAGEVRANSSGDAPTPRHRRLAQTALAHDTTLLAASEQRGNDLRLAVATPMRTVAGRGFAVVLDVSAATQLRRRLPTLAWAGQAGRTAITFPFDAGFVGATWTAGSDQPRIGWPKQGWSLTDSSLIVVAGKLTDTTPRLELGLPRAAASALVDTRAAWLHATAALIALPLCVAVLLVGRGARNRHLRSTEKSLTESRLRTAEAETATTRAQVAAIQARLNPHFLSNALHSVAALVSSDPHAAEEALDRLGDLFRYSLEQSERRAVPLSDEWSFVQDYLAIEQLRLGHRLTVALALDAAAARCEIPPFTLQPLVENALRHGISPCRHGGTLNVGVRLRDRRLELVVADDGAGADPSTLASSSGTGLRTLRQRLALDEAFAGRLEVETTPGAGFRVRVTLAAIEAEPRAERGSEARECAAPVSTPRGR